MTRALTVSLVLTLLASAGCRGKASPEECTRMLDRYVDLTIEPSETQNLTPAQVAAIHDMKRAIRKSEPLWGRVVSRCERELSRGVYDCAMKAGNANEWEACVQD